MSVRITTLIENTQGEHLALNIEHGISFLIEKDTHTLLFDTGQSGAFLFNAAELRLNIASVEHVILSHGHYDHTGGLRALCDRIEGFDLTMGKGFFDEKYGVRNGSYEFLGNNFDQNFLNERGIPYRELESRITEIVPGVYAVTQFERSHADEKINPRFVLRRGNGFVPDRFEDEILLGVDTPKGLVVILGCAHPGMKNMLETVRSALKRPIYAILGGTHLVESPKESMQLSVDYLGDEALQLVGVSHCTGKEAMERLQSSNSRYFHNRTGSSLLID